MIRTDSKLLDAMEMGAQNQASGNLAIEAVAEEEAPLGQSRDRAGSISAGHVMEEDPNQEDPNQEGPIQEEHA